MDAKWRAAVDAFLTEVYQRSGSRDTRYTYGLILRQFFQDHPEPGSVTALQVQLFAYKSKLNGEAPGPGCVRGRLAPLRSFYRACIRWGMVDGNPAEKVPQPRPRRPIPRAITDEQVARLLDAIPATLYRRPKARLRAARDEAIITLLYYAGLRRAEALSLTAGHIQAGIRSNDGASLFVALRTKGGETRSIHLVPPVLGAIRRWVEAQGKRVEEMPPGERIWKMNPATLCKAVAKYAREAGVGKVTPHVFRHATTCTRLRLGADLQHCQAILGHANVSTTDRYAKQLRPAEDAHWKELHESLEKKRHRVA